MTTPQQHLDAALDAILADTGAPAIAAVLVRDKGKTRVTSARGRRRADRPATESANKVVSTDRFCIGSVSKPVSGFLLAALVDAKVFPKAWKTTIADVFPEFASPACRARLGIRADYLGATVEQLMGHTALFPYAPTHGFDYNQCFKDMAGPRLAEYLSRGSTLDRSLQYVVAAMQDPPDTPLEPEGVDQAFDSYGGSTMIACTMAERLTGQTFRELLQSRVLTPLAMTATSLGRTSSDALPPDGAWQHARGTGGVSLPHLPTALPAYDVHSHGPAGAINMSATDMATFIVANLSESGAAKTVVSDATLRFMQKPVAPISLPFMPSPMSTGRSASGWALASDHVWHTGDNGVSTAALRIYPAKNYGVAAMVNRKDDEAWSRALDTLEDMNQRWTALFG
jgi:CubicO group peptidase (beta-lactamase class C family)